MKTLLLLLSLGAVVPAIGAVEGGVHGRVYGQDASGANLGPLAGATIELTADSGGLAAKVQTNQSGYYQIPSLGTGAYRYKVTAAGYQPEDQQRGFAMPAGSQQYVHDFLLSKQLSPSAKPASQKTVVQPAIHGRVYGQSDRGDNLGPVPGAKVELLSGGSGTVVATAITSSPGGYYEIKDLPAADYRYRISAVGYTTEDSGRGFTVPGGTLEYVHDFLLSKPPPKRFRCDVPLLVVKVLSDGKNSANDARVPVAGAKILLQPPPGAQTSLHQPFVTDAKGEQRLRDLPEGEYAVAIDAPECEPFTGTLKVVCRQTDEEVILEVKPCNEVLHGYVRTLLTDGWGASSQAQGAGERAYQKALKAGSPQDGSLAYARALTLLSAGQLDAGHQQLLAAVGKKGDHGTWDRACEARLWITLCLHQAGQAVKEVRSLVKNHYASRPSSPAAKDTAAVCGVTLGLIKGPWKDLVNTGDAALLEAELMSGLKGDLRIACTNARDDLLAKYTTLKEAEDAARGALVADATARHETEVARLTERLNQINAQVTAVDAELQTLQATVNQFDQQYRVQIAGFAQQRQQLAVQAAPLAARLQQITACLAQDQAKYQALAAQQQMPQSPTVNNQQGMMRQDTGAAQAVLVEMQQHQAEIQQLQTQLRVIQNQDAQFAAQIANLQNRFNTEAAGAQANLNTKLRQRDGLANEFEKVDRQRTAPFDPAAATTPELEDAVRRQRSLKTYRDFPLETRREELLAQFSCGASKAGQPQLRPSTVPISIQEPSFPKTGRLSGSNAPGQNTSPDMRRALPAGPPPGSMDSIRDQARPPRQVQPGGGGLTVPVPQAQVGDAAQLVLSNNLTGAIRLFGINPGSQNEMLVRILQAGDEATIPASVGQTFIIRAEVGGQEVRRHRMTKKLEVLKLGGARAD